MRAYTSLEKDRYSMPIRLSTFSTFRISFDGNLFSEMKLIGLSLTCQDSKIYSKNDVKKYHLLFLYTPALHLLVLHTEDGMLQNAAKKEMSSEWN